MSTDTKAGFIYITWPPQIPTRSMAVVPPTGALIRFSTTTNINIQHKALMDASLGFMGVNGSVVNKNVYKVVFALWTFN